MKGQLITLRQAQYWRVGQDNRPSTEMCMREMGR
jgi:hypothetical protein